jgi:Tfp pilus assembly protein PilF
MGDFEAAVMAFERVLIIDPEAVEVKVELANSYYRLGANEVARQYFEEALAGDLPEDVRQGVISFLEELKRAH